MHDETLIKVTTLVVLGVVLLAAVVMLGVVAVMTTRDLFRAEVFTFGGVVLVAALGGLSWVSFRRRRRWHLQVDRDDDT